MNLLYHYTPVAYKIGETRPLFPVDVDSSFEFSRDGSAYRINMKNELEEMASDMPLIDYTDPGTTPSLIVSGLVTNLIKDNTNSLENYITPAADFDVQEVTPGVSASTNGPIKDVSCWAVRQPISGASSGGSIRPSVPTLVEKDEYYTCTWLIKNGISDYIFLSLKAEDGRSGFAILDMNDNIVTQTNHEFDGFETDIKKLSNHWIVFSIAFKIDADTLIEPRLRFNGSPTENHNVIHDRNKFIFWGGLSLTKGKEFKTWVKGGDGVVQTRVRDGIPYIKDGSNIIKDEGAFEVILKKQDDLYKGGVYLQGQVSEIGHIGFDMTADYIEFKLATPQGENIFFRHNVETIGEYHTIRMEWFDGLGFSMYLNGEYIGTKQYNINVSDYNSLSIGRTYGPASVKVKDIKIYG